MPTPDSPDELSSTLRQLRTEKGLTLAEVAASTGLSVATVGKLLKGRYAASPAQAESLARALGATAAVRRRVVQLARDVEERTAPRPALIRGTVRYQQQFGEIERTAGHVRSFSPVMPPGQLQTAAYARVIFAGLPEAQREVNVAERVKRGAALMAETGPAHTIVLTEGALRWHVGSPSVMAEQCDHIATVAESAPPRVQVGIIPWTTPVRVFPMHSFDLYDTRVVIFGTRTGTAFVTAQADVARFVELHAELTTLAVFGDSAASAARGLRDRYRALDRAD